MSTENQRRVARAANMLIQTRYKTDDLDWLCSISDAIADLCHLADSHAIDMESAFEMARNYFEIECEEDREEAIDFNGLPDAR